MTFLRDKLDPIEGLRDTFEPNDVDLSPDFITSGMKYAWPNQINENICGNKLTPVLVSIAFGGFLGIIERFMRLIA